MDLVALISAVATAVKQVEEAAKANPNANGVMKLNAALALVQELVGDVAPILPVVQSIIGALVASYNIRGIFAKKSG